MASQLTSLDNRRYFSMPFLIWQFLPKSLCGNEEPRQVHYEQSRGQAGQV
ncbi:MAG: hypothetical protein MAG451_01431 [Anaerolineales bacterium]|nr:hypothetical protein [Anaerolineales bacterium]